MIEAHYLLNRQHRWAAVGISGNACPALKRSVRESAGLEGGDYPGICCPDGTPELAGHFASISDGKPPGMFVFAVWQDPVERFASICLQFLAGQATGEPAACPATLDGWIEMAEKDLCKPVPEQAFHFRRQADHYTMADVDAVVDIERLPEWFEGRGWGRLADSGALEGRDIHVSPEQEARLRRLYARDYEEIRPTVLIQRAKQQVSSLWIGRRLPPLARLAVQSYLDHGFGFRLMTYGAVEGVPDGAEVCDAAAVLPREAIYQHATGSFAPFSDWFRYRMLHDHGGTWTDLDMVCMKPFGSGGEPWFGYEGDEIVSNALVRFPRNHGLLARLLSLAEDPSFPLPWDDADVLKEKDELRKRYPSLPVRRMNCRWGSAGPVAFTEALKHAGMLRLAAPAAALCPVHWGRWRDLFTEARSLDDSAFDNTIALHLWGEMIRREPMDLSSLPGNSIVASLMKRHRIGRDPDKGRGTDPQAARILVGICSCRKNTERRQTIRETWAGPKAANVEAVFFVGGERGAMENEPDILQVDAPDDYLALPEKVTAFFRAALKSRDFDWLFKCDDDTYLALDRLKDLVGGHHEFAGNEFLRSRGSPSGGAGYLLSRRLVELLASDPSIPRQGDEDVLIGEAAIRHGAASFATSRLCWNNSRFPRKDNDIITSHWCRPEQLRAVHSIYVSECTEVLDVHHPDWSDKLSFSPEGFFARNSTGCMGTWSGNGRSRRLKWFDWGEEQINRSLRNGAAFHCVKTTVQELVVELRGGLGNQMFQYAHALALSRRFNLPLKIAYANYGRPYGLGIFGLNLDPDAGEAFEWLEYNDHLPQDGSWPTASALRTMNGPRIRLAGYFQNELFFLPVADEIRRIFSLPKRRPPVAEEKTPVCIHVRRGDFVGSGSHSVCNDSYYLDAMRAMRGLVENPAFVVFSDDPDWCRTFFAKAGETVLVPDKETERETLESMLGCAAFILSNSTFGWWAAWLSESPLVIAPGRFLNGRDWSVCPERWIQMPAAGLKETSPRPPR